MGLQQWQRSCMLRLPERQITSHAHLFCLAFLLSVYFVPCVLPLKEEWKTEVISLVANVETLGPLQTLTIWQLPDGPIRKVFVIFEGRDATPYEYWDRSPSCPLCSGLPENRKIVTDALSRNYAVVVPESISPRGDWDTWPENTPDLQNVVLILSEWKRSHSLVNLPTVALGSSAGGKAVTSLALRPGMFESVAVMVSLGQRRVWKAATEAYPPTMFIYMPKDSKITKCIQPLRSQLGVKGVPTEEATWDEHPITKHWFAQLIPGLDLATSTAILEVLIGHGDILDENKFIKPRSSSFSQTWTNLVRELLKNVLPQDPENPERVMFESSVFQELKTAYAQHSILSRRDEEMFAWFDAGYDAQKRETII